MSLPKAAENERFDDVKKLLDGGRDINETDENGGMRSVVMLFA